MKSTEKDNLDKQHAAVLKFEINKKIASQLIIIRYHQNSNSLKNIFIDEFECEFEF